ncbi:hypothetical protein [Pseudoalteromonas sp.]|uniref:hypothetical protein n=1 Tax=Pseudoalteromonas sp. TaxID=53249 RepID=UPI0026339143|nr:hypothetical protein [Pseudoalteromonas sp.]MCP4585327.1 hypothetical protein [Pseudoalteromonas sp.]
MFKRLFMMFLILIFAGFAFGMAPDGVTTFSGGVFIGDPGNDTATTTPGEDDLYVKGTFEVDGAVSIDAGLNRAELTQENLAVYTIPLSDVLVSDGSTLSSADTEDSGHHYISYSTGGLILMGNSPNSDTQTDVSIVQFSMPPEYVDGETVTIRLYAEYTADGDTKTIDVSAYEFSVSDGSAVDGTDLCSTAAGTLSSDGSVFNFTVTPTNLAAGDVLIFTVTTAFEDDNGTTGEAQIDAIQVLLDIKG